MKKDKEAERFRLAQNWYGKHYGSLNQAQMQSIERWLSKNRKEEK